MLRTNKDKKREHFTMMSCRSAQDLAQMLSWLPYFNEHVPLKTEQN